MKNLELQNTELKSLDNDELEEIDGGWWFLIPLALAALNTDWDKAAADFERGRNSN